MGEISSRASPDLLTSSPIQDCGGRCTLFPALSEAGALIVTDDDLNDNSNTASEGTFIVIGDDDCDAIT